MMCAGVTEVYQPTGRVLTFLIVASAGIGLFLLDLVRLASDARFSQSNGIEDVYVWGSLLAGLVAAGVGSVSSNSIVRAVVAGLILVVWGAFKALILGSPSIIPASYAVLAGMVAGGLTAVDGFSAIRSQLDEVVKLPPIERVSNLQVIRSELQFYLERFVFALTAIVTIVGVTMTIVYTGDFLPADIAAQGADAVRSQRTALAFSMLSTASIVIGAAVLYGGVPLAVLYWDTRTHLLRTRVADRPLPASSPRQACGRLLVLAFVLLTGVMVRLIAIGRKERGA
jgi:hypothetical protein